MAQQFLVISLQNNIRIVLCNSPQCTNEPTGLGSTYKTSTFCYIRNILMKSNFTLNFQILFISVGSEKVCGLEAPSVKHYRCLAVISLSGWLGWMTIFALLYWNKANSNCSLKMALESVDRFRPNFNHSGLCLKSTAIQLKCPLLFTSDKLAICQVW